MSDDAVLKDFLSKDGSLEMIIEIGESGASFTEIDNNVSISHSTITERFSAVEGLRVFDKRISDDSASDHTYILDSKGQVVLRKLDEVGAIEKYYQLKKLRQDFEKSCSRVDELFADDGTFSPLTEGKGTEDIELVKDDSLGTAGEDFQDADDKLN